MFQKGSHSGGKKRGEPCNRFNKGICMYGLSCHYDHHCSVKSSGKWGHGVHICRLRNQDNDDNINSKVREHPSITSHKK